MQKSEERESAPAVIWRKAFQMGHIQCGILVIYSGKYAELRIGNTGLMVMAEVWADVFKTMRVDEIT